MASTEKGIPVEAAVSFQSILFDRDRDGDAEPEQPPFFGDLHLDQVLTSLSDGREEYRLESFFWRPLREAEAVHYRHHALRDLEQEAVLEAVRAFADGMRRMRECLQLARRLYYARQRQRWFVEAVAVYCDTVGSFSSKLAPPELRSRGFLSLRAYLTEYAGSEPFAALVAETRALEDELAAVRYTIQIRGARVRVSRYQDEADMSEEVERAFAKFKRGAVEDHRVRFRASTEMNHVEAQVLDLVAKLHPDTFSTLDAYCARHQDYLDDTIARFDREVQFYLAYLEYIEPLKAKGLAFSYPRVSARSKEVRAAQTFDLALAAKLLGDGATVVCNDFQLGDPERILVVSGPNNGGKTTFARTFGQLHYLASLGLPVPGANTRLFLADEMFTHFEREEELETLRGKFEDELFRIHQILQRATSDSVLIMNESFGSTTLRDALLVGTEVMKQIIELDALCVFVTFVDELASLSDTTVSMMSTVVADDPAVRTFKIVRKPADGLAYAAAIAEKYGLTYHSLRRRLAR